MSTSSNGTNGKKPSRESPDDCADPILASAAGLVTMGATEDEVDIRMKRGVADALRSQVIHISEGDFGGMEVMLTSQAMLLHKMFTRSASKYASAKEMLAEQLHAGVALRAQSHCRMTVKTLREMKRGGSQKPRNDQRDLLPYFAPRPPHIPGSYKDLHYENTQASMDSGATGGAGSADGWLAYMAKMAGQGR